MRLLAWDTSTKTGAIAALEWQGEGTPSRLVAELTLNVETTHSEQLLWGVHRVLESARWKLEDIDVFGVGVGPGSFTGLRIGITTARTLAHTMGKPLIGVSSLAAMIRPAAEWLALQKAPVILIAATDACKGELFALWGDREVVIRPDDLMSELKKKLKAKSTRWMVLGLGRDRYPDAWSQLPKKQELKTPFPFSDLVQGRYVAMLAREAFEAGKACEALDVHPRYLRASDAELKLKAGLLKPAPV